MLNILQVPNPTELFGSMLNVMDFKLVKEDNFYGLLDMQGANLGDIESDKFTSASQIVERLDIYIADYFLADIEEEFEVWCQTNNPLLWKKFSHSIETLYSCEDWVVFAENNIGHQEIKQFVDEYLFDFQVLYMICYDIDKINLCEVCLQNS